MTDESNLLSDIIAKMTELAYADGKITEEEEELLTAAQINLMIYDEALEDALEDGIIDSEESEVLAGLKQQILDGAWQVASESDGISDDELKLLEVLLSKIKE